MNSDGVNYNNNVDSQLNFQEQNTRKHPMDPIPFQLNSIATETLNNTNSTASSSILINTSEKKNKKTRADDYDQSVKYHDNSAENFLLGKQSPTHNVTNISNIVRQRTGGNPYDSDEPEPTCVPCTNKPTSILTPKPQRQSSGNNPYDPDPDQPGLVIKDSNNPYDPDPTGLPIKPKVKHLSNNPYDPDPTSDIQPKTDYKAVAKTALNIGVKVGMNVVAGNFIDKGYELAEKIKDTAYNLGEFAVGINNYNDFKDSWDLKIYERKNKNGVIKNIERDASFLEKSREAAANLAIGASKVVGLTAITHGGISQVLGSTGGISSVTQIMFNGVWGLASTTASVGLAAGKAVVPTIVNAGMGLVSGAINDPVEATVGLATANMTYGAVKCFKAASKTDDMLSKIGYGLAGTAQAVGALYGAIWVLKV